METPSEPVAASEDFAPFIELADPPPSPTTAQIAGMPLALIAYDWVVEGERVRYGPTSEIEAREVIFATLSRDTLRSSEPVLEMSGTPPPGLVTFLFYSDIDAFGMPAGNPRTVSCSQGTETADCEWAVGSNSVRLLSLPSVDDRALVVIADYLLISGAGLSGERAVVRWGGMIR